MEGATLGSPAPRKTNDSRFLTYDICDLESSTYKVIVTILGRGYLVVPLGNGEGEGYRYMDLQVSASG